ncbi:MAG: hypothetical protein JST68_01885 [Bacteroidetes bacterium]|nr:hypothetical protein [Bacteroidota bacterium]
MEGINRISGGRRWMMLLAFCAGAVVLFYSNLGRTFVADDFVVMKRVGLDGTIRTPGFFRPLSDVTLWCSYKLVGFRPWGYYLFNMLLHGVNCWLFFLFCLRFKWTDDERQQRVYALIASLLFLVYPIHSEAINWVLGRGASMAAFFALSSLIVVLSGDGLLWACLLYFLGMTAYEPAIFIPITWLAVLYVRGGNWRVLVRWVGASAVVLLISLLCRAVFAGSVTGEYGNDFFGVGWRRWAANVPKVGGRLFLPPNDDSYWVLMVFVGVLVVLGGIGIIFLWRTWRRPLLRKYLVGLVVMLLSACILPVLTAVSTRTSESDRMLYMPSVFLCGLVAFLLVFWGWRRKVVLAVLTVVIGGYMVFFLEKGNRNWVAASDVVRDVLDKTISRAPGGKLFLINLPDERDGAFIFRQGLSEAMIINEIDTTGVVVVSHLTRDEEVVFPAMGIVLPPRVRLRRLGADSTEIEGLGGRWVAGPRDRVVDFGGGKGVLSTSLESVSRICLPYRTRD